MATNPNNVQAYARGEKRHEFRTTRDGIVPSSIAALSRLTLDAAMKAALTHAGAKLVVEMDAGGTRTLLADSRTNQLIGGPEDLQKLGSIRTFVNRERKEAAGVEAAKDTTQLAFLAEKMVKDIDTGFEMKPVETSYAAALRPLQSALQQSLENAKKVEENSSTSDRDLYEPELMRLFSSIGCAYAQTICLLTQGGSIKGVLNENLFNNGVPEWVHSRFVSKSFTLERTGELRKLFFPADPTKGFALSVKEWRNVDFCKKQGRLLEPSVLAYEFVNDDDLMRAITGISASVSLSDEENPLVAKALRTKVTAMPVTTSSDTVIAVGSKTRSGFKFPSPSMDTVSGAIIALSTALLRVYSANLQSVDLVGDYYATIVPGAVRREDVTPTNNFYVQWGKADDKSSVWLDAIKGGAEDLNLRQKVWRWIRTELRLSEAAPAGNALAEVLNLEEGGKMPLDGHTDGIISSDREGDFNRLDGPPGAQPPEELTKPNLGLVLTRPLQDTELPFWLQFQERVFSAKAGKKRQPVGLALTPITPQGKALLTRVRKHSPYVSERMHSWLRSFSDERLQLAAIKVTNAEFDDIFSSSVDEYEDQSEVDWAEQEA